MNTSFSEQRLRDLESNVNEELEILKGYEDNLRYTADPREKIRSRKEIERTRESAKSCQDEYSQLLQSVKDNPVESQFIDQLGQVAEKLDVLMGGQQNLQGEIQTIREDLAKTHQTLLSRYNEGERTIVASIADTLNQHQIVLVQTLLDKIDSNQVDEHQMQEMFHVLEQRISTLHSEQADVIAKVLKSPEVDFKQRLKIAIPLIQKLIPFIPGIEYEAELELGTGVNIGTVWTKLINKLKGK